MKFKSDIEVQAGLKDSSGSNGTSGQILSSNGTTVSWVPPGTSYASDVQNEVKAGVAIGKGQAVYVTSADGTNIIVGLASNTTEATSSKTLGLLDATVAINGFANVVQIGRLEGLNTSTAVVGDPVWLGTSGNLIYGLANKPYAPAHLVYIGVVTRVNANNGEIFINVQNGFELKEIHDVDIVSTAPVGNDILAFEGAPVNLWKNKTIPAVLGYTPADQAITISTTAPLSGGGNLSANRTLSIVQANATTNGYLSSADWTTFNNKQTVLNGTGFVKVSGTTVTYDNSTYVPTSRTITINGVTQDLSANQTWTVSGGIGGSGTTNYIPKFTAATTVADSQLIDNGTYLSIGNPTNTRIKWGGTTTPTLGFPFSPTNALWLEVNDGDTGGIAIDNDGVTVYGAGDNGYVFRVIDEDVYQSTLNVTSATTFQVNQGQNGGGYVRGVFNVTDYLTADNSARSPIFYDLNNTGYYLDPASTSNLNVVNANSFNGKITILGGTSTVIGQVQTTSSINMGIVANNYGYGISTNNSGGLDIMANQSGQPVRIYAGSINESPTLSGNFNGGILTVPGDIRTPIFYDSNNTGYYVDPAGGSNLSSVYADNWFRTYGQTGLYSQTYGVHFAPTGSAAWQITGSGGNVELQFRSNHNSTVRGYVYADTSNNIGFLNNGGGWALRTDSSNNAYIYGTTLIVNANNAGSSSIDMIDGDEGTRSIHCNSNRIGFLNQSSSWGSYCVDNGDWVTDSISWAGASSRAPIFYDSNDTGYYVDPASNSNLNTLSIGGQKTLSAGPTNGITGSINAIWGMLKSAGYKIYPDEQFNDGNNGVNSYNNAGGSGIIITRKNSAFADSSASPMPNASGWVLEIRHAPTESSGTSPGYGGFYFATYSGPGSKRMICTFKMKIPAGRTIEFASNSIGAGGDSQWLTSNAGTGKYQDYAYLVNSGTSGWSSTFFFYINGGDSSTFYTYLASATVYDVTNVGEENVRIQSASSGMYSPIYYDSNDTAYYINPADGDVSAVLKGTVTIGGGTGGNYDEGLRIIDSNGFSVITFGASGNSGPGRYQFLKNNSDDFELRNASGTRIWSTTQAGDVTTAYVAYAGVSMRAPIFYDSTNTGYYIDPASTSNLYSLSIAPGLNQTGLTVNHGTGTGAPAAKFNSAGGGTTYGADTIIVDSCNYGSGIKIVTGLWGASQQAIAFRSNTTSVGSISCTTSATAYNTSSDYRLKENVVPMQYSISRLKELNPCRFNFINSPEKTVDGFIAHEVQEVIPEAITGEKDELDYDGSPKYQGIDQSKLVPLLTAALQEAISKIEELENRLSILENK